MNRKAVTGHPLFSTIDWGARIADLTEAGYQTDLLINALVDCLVEKGLLTREELQRSADEMDRQLSRLLEWERSEPGSGDSGEG